MIAVLALLSLGITCAVPLDMKKDPKIVLVADEKEEKDLDDWEIVITRKGAGTPADVDECAKELHKCDPHALCENIKGGKDSYECHCNNGFGWVGEGLGDPGTVCHDIDECAIAGSDCSPDATCYNTEGSFICASSTGLIDELPGCNPGFSGDGKTCADIDECVEVQDTCAQNADCTNHNGGFTCTCITGFAGDGDISCGDIHECNAGSHDCAAEATCVNQVGSFSCECNTGYHGDGTACTDINECSEGTSGCDPNAICTNVPGGSTCACKPGFNGDGMTCVAPKSPTTVLPMPPAAGCTSQDAPIGMIWEVAGEIDGGLSTWIYDADIWTDDTLLDTATESKSAAWFKPFTAVKLRMSFNGQAREIYFPFSTEQASLKALFSGGEVTTTADDGCWRFIVPDGDYQPNCNKQGFNNKVSSGNQDFLRIGIYYNNENDCNSIDVVTGVGIKMTNWNGHYASANYVYCCSANGRPTRTAQSSILIGYMP